MAQPAPAQALPYGEARAILVRELERSVPPPLSEKVVLTEALGRVLAEDVRADRDYPTLDRTARDGFAVRSSDLPGRLRVAGEVRAGERYAGCLQPGEAIEIMTGAPIPDGADAVIMIEHVAIERSGEDVAIRFEKGVPAGQFINYKGGESTSGQLLLKAGTRVSFAEAGLLASVGCVSPSVYVKPRVAILSTGDELTELSAAPAPHQIRNSNAYSLAAQVSAAGGTPEILGVARDDEASTRVLVERGLTYDLLLLSGGVSAGKYDFVERVLASLGAHFFFTRVAIQPGQPLVFGTARGRFFFGLPGNPASTMVTFEVFARTAVEALAGRSIREPLFLEGRLGADYKHRPGLTRFLPALVVPGPIVHPVAWTGSSDIASLTRANAFMVVDPDRAEWLAGDYIKILPHE